MLKELVEYIVKKLVDKLDYQGDVLEEGKHFVFRILKRRADIICNQNAKLEKISGVIKQIDDIIDEKHPAYDLIKQIKDTI